MDENDTDFTSVPPKRRKGEHDRPHRPWLSKPQNILMVLGIMFAGGFTTLATFGSHIEGAWNEHEDKIQLVETESNDVRQIKKGLRQLANEVEGQEWRTFKIEQRLQIEDDPPRRLQFDWENASITVLTNLSVAQAFRTNEITINDP